MMSILQEGFSCWLLLGWCTARSTTSRAGGFLAEYQYENLLTSHVREIHKDDTVKLAMVLISTKI